MHSRFFLGVDGGGTKTAYVLIDGRGVLLAQAQGGSIDILQTGEAGYAAALRDGVEAVCARAGIPAAHISGAVIGVPRLGELAALTPRMRAIPCEVLSLDVRCVNDVEVGHAGALACRPGIAVVAGTGAIGFGKNAAGKTMRCGGWSEFFGDEGSAYWLGRKTLGLFSKQSDGRLPRGALYDIVREKLSLADDLDVIALTERSFALERAQTAGLQRLLHEAAVRGDPSALAAYDAAADEIACLVESLYDGLRFSGQVPVSYAGGLFHAQSLLLPRLTRRLQPARAALTEPLLPPACGAALMALLAGMGLDPALPPAQALTARLCASLADKRDPHDP